MTIRDFIAIRIWQQTEENENQSEKGMREPTDDRKERERESSFTKREFKEREREKGNERGSDGAIFSVFLGLFADQIEMVTKKIFSQSNVCVQMYV